MSTVSLTLDTQELARHYEQVSAGHQFKAGQRLIEKLAVAPGEYVLDVGCGTGLLAEYVAGLVGPTGSVVGIDPLPLRIALTTFVTDQMCSSCHALSSRRQIKS